MSYRGGQGGGVPRVKKVMTQAINLIFEFLQKVCTGSKKTHDLTTSVMILIIHRLLIESRIHNMMEFIKSPSEILTC
jgi:hypothetical protein